MTRLRALPLLAATLAASLLPAAAAHGISPVPPEHFQVLLQDRTDDCGPEVVAGVLQNPQDCHGANALVGLALQERWDGAQDQLVFRFFLDAGKTGPFTDTLTLATPAGERALSIRSSDGASFASAGGFEAVGPVEHREKKADGSCCTTRFEVDATVARATLGLAVGDAITGFRVESKSGAAAGDEMPGGCHNTVGDCTAPANGEYIYGGGTGSYTVRGPGYYVRLDAPSGTQQATVGQDLARPITLDLRNLLRRTDQTVSLSVAGADGVAAGFHAGGTGMGVEYRPTLDVPLAGDAATALHLNLRGERAGASGTLTLTATTDLGGRAQVQLPYTVQEAASPTSTGGGATDAPTTTTKGTSAPAAALVGLALVGAALRRRA